MGGSDGDSTVEDYGGDYQPGCLSDDSIEAIIIGPDGSLHITPHHDDWEDVPWQRAKGTTYRRIIYWDSVVVVPVIESSPS